MQTTLHRVETCVSIAVGIKMHEHKFVGDVNQLCMSRVLIEFFQNRYHMAVFVPFQRLGKCLNLGAILPGCVQNDLCHVAAVVGDAKYGSSASC
jgi:hypothetical protein